MVSVVVPCYNLGEFVGEAVDSVLAQMWQNVEIVVIDDGSTDHETRELLAGFQRPKTRVIRTENRGLPGAKNLGVTHTSGQYLCFLDADDRLRPEMLTRSVEALEHDPSIAFVSHWVRLFGDESGEWRPTECGFPTLLDLNVVNGSALLRRSAFEAVGGFDESMRHGCEDWDLWIGLTARGLGGRILPEVLFDYRRRTGSMTRAMQADRRHPQLYAHLIERHIEAFRAHLPVLVARRERDLSTLRRHVADIQIELYESLEPTLARRRDDVAMFDRQVERARAEAAARQAATEAEALRVQTGSLRGEREALAAEVVRGHNEVAAVRDSLSWRVTRPLRVAYEWLGFAKSRGPQG
jgi:glycosyltransferase involved in cell wall biosynthesis